MPPIAVSVIASSVNCSRMSPLRAPMALRTPISRVRSVTDTSMMFMTPTPPTIRATLETANMKINTARRDLVPDVGERVLGEDGEIVRLIRAARGGGGASSSRISSTAFGMSACEVALTLMKCCLSSGCSLRNVDSGK